MGEHAARVAALDLRQVFLPTAGEIHIDLASVLFIMAALDQIAIHKGRDSAGCEFAGDADLLCKFTHRHVRRDVQTQDDIKLGLGQVVLTHIHQVEALHIIRKEAQKGENHFLFVSTVHLRFLLPAASASFIRFQYIKFENESQSFQEKYLIFLNS